MGAQVSTAGMIVTLLKKDFLAFSRDRIYSILSLAALILFIVVFWIFPMTVDESITVGISHHDLGMLLDAEVEEGIDLLVFPSEALLRSVISGDAEAWIGDDGKLIIRDVTDGESRPSGASKATVLVGLSFPEQFIISTAMGQQTTVTVYTNQDTPPEIRGAMVSFIREIAFMLAGSPLPVTEPDAEEIVLGTDRMGDQVSMRDRMRPMLAFFVLMMETFALASLIAAEISHKTITAILATPAKASHVLTAKTLFGTMLAMGQAIILLLATVSFSADNWLMLLVAVFLGALIFTSIAMVVGSMGKDFITTLFLSMLFTIPLAIPAFGVMFPGSTAPWVRIIPSYGIMQVLMDVTVYGMSWGDAWIYLTIAALWAAGLSAVGLTILKRKVVRL